MCVMAPEATFGQWPFHIARTCMQIPSQVGVMLSATIKPDGSWRARWPKKGQTAAPFFVLTVWNATIQL